MGTTDGSTLSERVTVVGPLLGHAGTYGLVTGLSRQMGVARQTLYTWREQGRAALKQVFAPPAAGRLANDGVVARRILTLLVEGHASDRGIQRCLAEQGQSISLGTISAVVTEAERRALGVSAQPLAVGPRIRAPSGRFDELYGNDRHGAYLSLVDAVSGAVWQTARLPAEPSSAGARAAGPIGVDTESWTLLLWEAHARGLRWSASIGDGGGSLSQAAAVAAPQTAHRRDVWHILHACSPVETWHSVLRPHLAVHRTLSPGLLALLAVAYNHRVAERGVHAGSSALQRSGLTGAPTDWPTALGYPPTKAAPPAGHRPDRQRQHAA